MPEPTAKPPTAPPHRATQPEPPNEPLPDHKQPLVELAITRGVPSYEAWAMTVDDLKKKLEA